MSLPAIKAVLREQILCYRALLDVLQKERVCLVDLDLPAMEELAKEKDTLLLRIRLLEEERARLARGLGGQDRTGPASGTGGTAGTTGEDAPTLRSLAEATGDASLLEMRLALRSLVQSLEELNGFNRVLIERCLDHVRAGAAFLGALGAAPSAEAGVLVSRKT